MKIKIEPTGLYRAISSFAQLTESGNFMVKAGAALAGTNDVVRRHPDRFVPADMPTDVEARIKQERLDARDAGQPVVQEPRATILRPIPPERRMRAVQHYHGHDGVVVEIGAIYDERDEFVRANLSLFEQA